MNHQIKHNEKVMTEIEKKVIKKVISLLRDMNPSSATYAVRHSKMDQQTIDYCNEAAATIEKNKSESIDWLKALLE